METTIIFIGKVLFMLPMGLAAVNHFLQTTQLAEYAKSKGIIYPEFMVRFSAVILILGLVAGFMGTWFGLLATVFFLVTAIKMHDFWNYPPAERGAEFAHFLKNVAIAGGSILIMFL